jgi:hypothetical protein
MTTSAPSRLGLLPERGEVRLRELPARNVGQDLRAFHAERRHAALELVRRFRAVKQRHGAERDEAVGLARHVFRKSVVHHARGFDRDVERHGIEALVRRRHHQLHVDAHGVEIGEALVIAGDARANVLVLLSGQRLGLGIGKMRKRNRGHVEVRLDEGRGLRDRDVGVDVDGGAFRPDLAARIAVLARRSRCVLVPLLGHCCSMVFLKMAIVKTHPSAATRWRHRA